MGRPLKKSLFGPATGVNEGVVIVAHIPALNTAGYVSGAGGSSAQVSYIVRQVGSRKYVVQNAEGVGRVVLTNNPTPAAGEAYLVGYTATTTVSIQKLTARQAVDFDGNRYSWYLENDSTADVIRLTAI